MRDAQKRGAIRRQGQFALVDEPEIARVAVFLSSEDCSYVTGATLVEEARAYLTKLQSILRYLGASQADMERYR